MKAINSSRFATRGTSHPESIAAFKLAKVKGRYWLTRSESDLQ
jgi:hypothetical protein